MTDGRAIKNDYGAKVTVPMQFYELNMAMYRAVNLPRVWQFFTTVSWFFHLFDCDFSRILHYNVGLTLVNLPHRWWLSNWISWHRSPARIWRMSVTANFRRWQVPSRLLCRNLVIFIPWWPWRCVWNQQISASGCLVGWLVFNGTFSTNRLYCALRGMIHVA